MNSTVTTSGGWTHLTNLTVSAGGGAASRRRGEPVTTGLPFPRGLVHDVARIALRDAGGRRQMLQARVLERWSDGSIRWALLDFTADVPGGCSVVSVEAGLDGASGMPPASRHLAIVDRDDRIEVTAGPASFSIGRPPRFALSLGDDAAAASASLEVHDADGGAWPVEVESVGVEEAGPLRAIALVTGRARRPGARRWLHVACRLRFFAGLPVARVDLTIRNPHCARHAGGLWDLGDPGSVHLSDVSFTLRLDRTPKGGIRCSPEPGLPLEDCGGGAELVQGSSGRPNWHSVNHVNRHGNIPPRARGYRLSTGHGERSGLCATPIMAAGPIVLAVPEFWQNFPRALEASGTAVTLRLFPHQYDDGHELQGGEQKTHRFWIGFDHDPVTDTPLDWSRDPLVAIAEPAWYSASQAVPFLTPSAQADPRYATLVAQGIEGDSSFLRKRDVVDEYGWRNFGDLYADHESVYHKGSEQFISHYNNQYDAVGGFACHFLMSGDPRWWSLMDELARHVIDIDVYHTTEDKAAFNGGLFWHTFHYLPAGRSTHRSYPNAPGVDGGGPSSEHDYSTGLMLHYYLTGDAASRETVIGLARWVVEMDDGGKTIFRWLDRGPTGLASATGSPLYHGPGRGPANSVQTLLNAFRLTGERSSLRKAEELIARCIHPDDDIEALNLLDAERRWYYTVFLEALGRYLHEQDERGERGRMYAYARASLLHYVRWMVDHEYPYLEKPEILEYPNETWPAQDVRKTEIFDHAAMHADGDDRERFHERARFFYDYSVSTLNEMPTSAFARPTVLMLSHAFAHAWFLQHPDAALPAPDDPVADFGPKRPFVPQKARAMRRAKVLAAGGGVAALVAAAVLTFALL